MKRLSERLADADKYTERLQKLKMDTANAAVASFMQTDQWKLAVEAMPNNGIAVDALIQATVTAVTDPVNDFIDVLRARGFRQGEIRGLVHKMYSLYCAPLDQSDKEQQLIYENILPTVAKYCLAHQEVFATLDPELLRESK